MARSEPRIDESRARAQRELGAFGQFFLSVYWLAYNLQWAALLAIVIPSQIAGIAGEARKEATTGGVIALGALLSLVVAPLAGALSDRSRSRLGRRGPFVIAGTALNALLLVIMSGMGPGTELGAYVFVFLGVQLASNWAGGPYAALLPDVVAERQRGAASGWMALMSTLGTLAGVLVAGQLARPGEYRATGLVIAIALLLAAVLTVAGVRETPHARGAGVTPPVPRSPAPSGARIPAAMRGIFPDPRAHRDFYWVLATRALIGMGIYSVFSFFQYFLDDVLHVERPEQQASYLLGAIIAAGIPTSLVAGALSDRLGRKPLVYLSGVMMAAASIAFIAAGIWPSMAWVFAVGVAFGIGYGAYQAVDWALAIDVLPSAAAAGKDMGIWHLALVVPQVIAPALSGALLGAFTPARPLTGYALVFTVTAVWFTLGTVLVSRIRRAR